MTKLDECADAVAETLGLSKAAVREIAKGLAEAKRKAIVKGENADEAVIAAGKEAAGDAKIKAALARKNAARNIVVRDKIDAQLPEMMPSRPDRSIAGYLVGLYGGFKRGRQSIAGMRQALEGAWIGGMGAEIDKILPHIAKLMQRPRDAKPFFDDVVREWRVPGSTKNADARAMADIFSKYTEAARLAANKAGANIGKIADWGGPQAHDAAKMLKAGKAKWIEDTFAGLDLERSFGATVDAAKAREILGSVYDTIITGVRATAGPREKGAYLGPANMASGLEKHRVLHFKTADDWLRYSDVYGRGNVMLGVVEHLQGMARTVSLMEGLGPNPERMLGSVIDDQRRMIRDSGLSDAAKQKALNNLNVDLANPKGEIGRAWAVVSGDTHRPHSISMARFGNNTRAVISMAKLGGMLFSSINDLMTYAQAMRWQGRGLLQSYAESFGALFAGRSAGEKKRLALTLGVGFDTFLGEIHGRYGAQDALVGKMSRAQNAFYKWTGINWWTDRLTTTFAVMTSSHLAEQSGKTWDALHPAYRVTLGEYGIGPADWPKIQKMVTTQGDYRFVWPEHAAGDRELEFKLRNFFADSATFGVVKGDDRTRMTSTLGTAPGTELGEAIRFMMQFKSFPIAYTQKILIPTFRGRGGQRDLIGIAHLAAASLAFGYASMWMHDLRKNKTPKDPSKLGTWGAAFVQSGGAGIFGDFFLGDANRMGGGLLETLAGPAVGTAAEGARVLWKGRDATIEALSDDTPSRTGHPLMADAVKFGLDNMPFLNLHVARAALDLAFLNQLQEYMSPGTFARREQKMEKSYDQKYIVDPLALSR